MDETKRDNNMDVSINTNMLKQKVARSKVDDLIDLDFIKNFK